MDLQDFDIGKRGAYGWKYDRINFATIYVQHFPSWDSQKNPKNCNLLKFSWPVLLKIF